LNLKGISVLPRVIARNEAIPNIQGERARLICKVGDCFVPRNDVLREIYCFLSRHPARHVILSDSEETCRFAILADRSFAIAQDDKE
jgi:hypothetical protein